MKRFILILACFLLSGCNSGIRKYKVDEFGYSSVSQIKTTLWRDKEGKYNIIHDKTSKIEFEKNKDDEVKLKVDGKQQSVLSNFLNTASTLATAELLKDDD